VAQGTGTTNWVVNRDLGADVLWYWRARATNGTVTSAFSVVETFSTGSPCSYALSPTTASLNGGGGTTTVTVTTASTCAWIAISNDSFLSVGGSGTGNGTFTVTAAPNGGTARTGTVTVGGTGTNATFTLTQDVNCVYNPTPNFVTLTNAAAAGQTFIVTTSFPTCAWRAASDSPWLAITAGDNNTGQGTVTFLVLANGTLAQRIGTITITGFIGGSGSFVLTQQP
jgi:trimeric autotransporter adhesin